MSGAFHGKYAGCFVSTGGPGGGQESTVIASMSTLTHHGFIYVPLGYKPVFGKTPHALLKIITRTNVRLAELNNVTEVRGGSPWGAGTFAGDGTRQPTALELKVATAQGKAFYEAVAKAHP